VPDTVDIKLVTVENDSLIRVVYHLYPAGSVQTLILERSDDGGTSFQAIDTLAFSGISVPQDSSFIDTTANVHAQSYHYRLVAIDYCLDPHTSLTSQSIYLDCYTSETENTLEWNKYEYWQKGVKGYDVYRILTGTPPTILLLDSVDQNTVSFNDPLTSYDNSKAVCYWIEGIENPGNYLNNTFSVSNTCCIIKEPVLYLPNAFRPESINDNNKFRPVPDFLYVDVQSFNMIIFSRWGQQLFETTDIINGWNGTINGQNAPTDQYSYIITYKSLADKEYTKRGTVTLIR
jgi:gliding motility-associated-like protein